MIYTALKTPGVYVNEISIFPPSVAQVPTAIPAFIGYTERHEKLNGETLRMIPTKISSLVEYQFYYGGGPKLEFNAAGGFGVELDSRNQVVKADNRQTYYMFDSLQLFFANGGGDCYIVSVDKYRPDGTVQFGTIVPVPSGMTGGVEALVEVDEPTMIVFPDAISLSGTSLYDLQIQALMQCGKLMDRVGVFDLKKAKSKTELTTVMQEFRDNIGMTDLKYGGVYAPWIKVGIKKDANYRSLKGNIVKAGTLIPVDLTTLVPPGDPDGIIPQITALDNITSDTILIDNRTDAYLANPTNAPYAPPAYAKNFPSLREGFDLTAQSFLNMLADADADGNIATKPGKVTTASTEYMKLVRQAYEMVRLIDDLTFLNPAFIKNLEFRDLAFTVIRYSANKTPIGALLNAFDLKVKELINLDTSANSIAGGVAEHALVSGGTTLIFNTGMFLPANFDVLNFAAGAPTPGIFTTNVVPVANTLPNENARVANLRDAFTKIKNLFGYFYDTLQMIITLGNNLAKAKEDALLKWSVYKGIVDAVNGTLSVLPPSGAMAGVYSRVDNERGVWKAPANVSVTLAKGTLVNITDAIQENMNVDVNAGKSVNAIRVFSGKGTMVWGARTLAGNDNEWRYIPVRRFFNMVEESVKKSTSWVVFEPNDANTWLKVKSMIENYLTLLWRQGALAGSKPDEAFRVYVGLNQTMTAIDILEGRMIIRIEMAAVRPAEFIILEFAHKLQTS